MNYSNINQFLHNRYLLNIEVNIVTMEFGGKI